MTSIRLTSITHASCLIPCRERHEDPSHVYQLCCCMNHRGIAAIHQTAEQLLEVPRCLKHSQLGQATYPSMCAQWVQEKIITRKSKRGALHLPHMESGISFVCHSDLKRQISAQQIFFKSSKVNTTCIARMLVKPDVWDFWAFSIHIIWQEYFHADPL